MNWVRSAAFGLFLIVSGALVGIVGYRWYDQRSQSYRPDIGSVAPPRLTRVTALGRIEPGAGVSNLGVGMPDVVQQIAPSIQEGATVKKGTPLIYFASKGDRQLEVDLLTLQIAEAGEKLAELKKIGEQRVELEQLKKKQLQQQSPAEVELQKSKVAVLTQQMESLRKTRERLTSLGQFSVSKQELEQQNLTVAQAESELRAAEEALQQMQKGNLLKQELAEGQIEAARGEVRKAQMEISIKSLEQQKQIAERKLEHSILRAPIDGTILKIAAVPGELVGPPQPVIQMADVSQMAVIAEVYETEAGRAKIGQKAKVTSRAWPDQTLTGVVESVGTIIARNRILDSDPTANVDRRVVEVRIKLDQANPASQLINHQVTVDISTE
ncbi:MAG: efflux RND transporter periplasmic adaptor subunit [Gemmataceae bacterium]|nr:efflux RND transporter periplasmic adaptor subunit [Gemmataceae bacterium]